MSNREGQQVSSQREFLKTLLGTAAGAAGLAAAGSLVTPSRVEAAYSTGTAPDGGDLVNTHLSVHGNLTLRGPHPWVDVRTYGAVGDGTTDDRWAIQTSINVAATGGTVFFPAGFTFRCGSPVVVDNMTGVRLVGGRSGQQANPSAAGVPTLLYTGSDPQFISFRSSRAVTMTGLAVRYDNPFFAGELVDCDWSSAPIPTDPVQIRIEDCSFSGTSSAARSARSLVRLNRTIISSIRNCWFGYGDVAVRGRDGGYSNAIQIENCAFNYQTTAAIKNAGESWVIQGCTFEPLFNGAPGAYTQDIGNNDPHAVGLTFVGNWCGDTTTGGTWVKAKVLGMDVSGNRFTNSLSGSTTSLHIRTSEGVHVAGNHIEGGTGILVDGSATGLAVMGNKFAGVTTPVANHTAITANTAAFLGNSGLANYVA